MKLFMTPFLLQVSNILSWRKHAIKLQYAFSTYCSFILSYSYDVAYVPRQQIKHIFLVFRLLVSITTIFLTDNHIRHNSNVGHFCHRRSLQTRTKVNRLYSRIWPHSCIWWNQCTPNKNLGSCWKVYINQFAAWQFVYYKVCSTKWNGWWSVQWQCDLWYS